MGTGGKCFIATAAYGSELAPEIKHLSAFRDEVLLRYKPGRLFVLFYTKTGPYFAKFIQSRTYLRAYIRFILKPIIYLIRRRSSK